MQHDTVIDQVIEVENRRFKALSSNDMDVIRDTLADDLRYVHANGVEEDKAEFLRKLISGERRYLSFVPDKRTARHENGLTFIFGEADMEVEKKDGVVRNRLIYTAIYRGAESAQLVAWQATRSGQ